MTSIKLGEKSAYESSYNPALLQPIARDNSRASLLKGEPAPFVGSDIWTAYELSWLEPGGKPRVAIAEFVFAASSSAIIESKSFKYYLNSYNQTQFASVDKVVERLQADLGEASGASVEVRVFAIDEYQRVLSSAPGLCVDSLDTGATVYAPDAHLLEYGSKTVVSAILFSHLLKSNCPVTGQPDWATVWVEYTGRELLAESFLRYVVSYRQHQDFHENCVEKIFCDLLSRGEPEKLAVYARYTRRGGLDINPYRATPNMGAVLPARLSALRVARQ